MVDDFDTCYRAIQSRDARFDGWFYVGVRSTGIYCRPSCPAITPKRGNVRFYPTAAAAQAGGHRACKRCRPDASPGSPEWNRRADLVGRAMRLIADGVVDREGVGGLAARLGYSERQVHRQLSSELGAGPLAISRAQRAQTARLLAEQSSMPLTDVAFAAGFSSVRQFNDTVRAVFAVTPSELRRRAPAGAAAVAPGCVNLRLPFREPFDQAALLGFLGARAVSGVESLGDDGTYGRTLRLAHGSALVRLRPAPGHVACAFRMDDLRDLTAGVERCRRLLDLDADPVAVDGALGGDPLLGPLVRRRPGRRVPGCVDGFELAVRAILGQQISVAGARTLAGRLTTALGDEVPFDQDVALTHLFPSADRIAEADPDGFGIPRARGRALVALAGAVTDGELQLDPGADRAATRAALLALPGIGPWTADYVAMRALADPDAFLPSDLGVRNGLAALGAPSDPAAAATLAEAWRPWRSYAVHHLWASLAPTTKEANT